MRKLIEIFSRRKILKRYLPKEFGSHPIFVSPDSALRYWSRNVENYDPQLFRICKELVKPKSVIWDIGANHGLFTLSSAYLAGTEGHVVAVEPDTFTVDLLNRSIFEGNCQKAKIDILPLAISDSIAMSDFHIAKRGRSTSFLAGTNSITDSGGIRETYSVLTVTLDWLLNYLPAPDVLKIDVECSEDRVLLGASKLLAEHRPAIFCETTDGPLPTIVNIFKKNSYIMYDIDNGLGQNIIALPKECNSVGYPPSHFMKIYDTAS